jgi:hypothetical protein
VEPYFDALQHLGYDNDLNLHIISIVSQSDENFPWDETFIPTFDDFQLQDQWSNFIGISSWEMERLKG